MKVTFQISQIAQTIASESNARRAADEQAAREGIRIVWLQRELATVEALTIKDRVVSGMDKSAAIAAHREFDAKLQRIFPSTSFRVVARSGA